ncbi:MAG: RluA family pseudouridine synthase, partial [Pseudomonadota bacterium]
MSGVQTLTVAAGEQGQRLDRWLKRRFPQVTQGFVEKSCRKGDIRVDGGRVKASTRVEEGQAIRVPPLPDCRAPAAPRRDKVVQADADMIRRCVIYRDDHILALNKPPGLASQGGSGQGARHVDGMGDALRFDAEEQPRLVHRLDKDTSGIMLMARNRLTAAALAEAFKSRDTRKIYWAAVAGVPTPRMGTIKYGLVKAGGAGDGGEKMRALHPDEVPQVKGAKNATSDYAVLDALGSRASWVALVPITGRTHQLRAHMAELGHP